MEDRERKRRFEQYRIRFKDEVIPTQILPYLDCLTNSMKEQVERWEDREGAQNAAYKLSLQLPKKDNWYEQLIVALRETNNEELADEISGIDRAATELNSDRTNQSENIGNEAAEGGSSARQGHMAEPSQGTTSRGGRRALEDTVGTDGGTAGGGAVSDAAGRSGVDADRVSKGMSRLPLDLNKHNLNSRQRHSQEIDLLHKPIGQLPYGLFQILDRLNNLDAMGNRDWRGLAAQMKISFTEFLKIESTANPTRELLNSWQQAPGATLQVLLGYLFAMEREDLVTDIEEELNIHWERPQTASSPITYTPHRAKAADITYTPHRAKAADITYTPHRAKAAETEACVTSSQPHHEDSSAAMQIGPHHASSVQQNSYACTPPAQVNHPSNEEAENQKTTVGEDSSKHPSFASTHQHEEASPHEALNTAHIEQASEASGYQHHVPQVQLLNDCDKPSQVSTTVKFVQAVEPSSGQSEAVNKFKTRDPTFPQTQQSLDATSDNSSFVTMRPNHNFAGRTQTDRNIVESDTDNNGSQGSCNSSSVGKSGHSKSLKSEPDKPYEQSLKGDVESIKTEPGTPNEKSPRDDGDRDQSKSVKSEYDKSCEQHFQDGGKSIDSKPENLNEGGYQDDSKSGQSKNEKSKSDKLNIQHLQDGGKNVKSESNRKKQSDGKSLKSEPEKRAEQRSQNRDRCVEGEPDKPTEQRPRGDDNQVAVNRHALPSVRNATESIIRPPVSIRNPHFNKHWYEGPEAKPYPLLSAVVANLPGNAANENPDDFASPKLLFSVSSEEDSRNSQQQVVSDTPNVVSLEVIQSEVNQPEQCQNTFDILFQLQQSPNTVNQKTMVVKHPIFERNQPLTAPTDATSCSLEISEEEPNIHQNMQVEQNLVASPTSRAQRSVHHHVGSTFADQKPTATQNVQLHNTQTDASPLFQNTTDQEATHQGQQHQSSAGAQEAQQVLSVNLPLEFHSAEDVQEGNQSEIGKLRSSESTQSSDTATEHPANRHSLIALIGHLSMALPSMTATTRPWL